MGIELVQGTDLIVEDGLVHMKTTQGLRRVDVIYRRIDDDFLDPKCFREDSCLGVDHLMEVCRAGRVTLANAPGTGVADDKAVYTYVPAHHQVLLGGGSDSAERPHLFVQRRQAAPARTGQPGQVGRQADQRVRRVWDPDGATGIGGSTSGLCCGRAGQPLANGSPSPMLNLSTVPTLVGDELKPRHVDLRPFVLCGEEIYVMPGGLTRVALKEGSMVVNSSQGGGSKDTWVLRRAPNCPGDAVAAMEARL